MCVTLCARVFHLTPLKFPGALCNLKVTPVFVFILILEPHEYCYKYFID